MKTFMKKWHAGASPRVLGGELVNAKNRPVTKVINVLKDMLKQLEKEKEDDEEIYEKMACWCIPPGLRWLNLGGDPITQPRLTKKSKVRVFEGGGHIKPK